MAGKCDYVKHGELAKFFQEKDFPFHTLGSMRTILFMRKQ